MAMIRVHERSPQFDPHSNYYTMCPVQNDQVRVPLTGPFIMNLWGPSYQMDHSNLEDLSCIRPAYMVLD